MTSARKSTFLGARCSNRREAEFVPGRSVSVFPNGKDLEMTVQGVSKNTMSDIGEKAYPLCIYIYIYST